MMKNDGVGGAIEDSYLEYLEESWDFQEKKMYQNSCPMGTMTQEICQIKNKSKFNAFK